MVAEIPPAPQHDATPQVITPRPLPLFLDLVRDVAMHDPEMARRALVGVRVYGSAPRPTPVPRPIAAQQGRATLRDGGGVSGPPVVLVPSLINPSRILDLDGERSLLAWLGQQGYRAMLLDWGTPDDTERTCDIAGHVETYLLPLLAQLNEPAHIVGYCLGGTMSVAAASLYPARSLTLMATPWHYAAYPDDARQGLARLWQQNVDSITALGLLPMEVLQTAFWNLDPQRTVAKFAALADRSPDDAVVSGFALLEDWANDGAPLTIGAANDLFHNFIHDDFPGSNRWSVGGKLIDPAGLTMPALQLVASGDRIAPSATASSALPQISCPSGHVGMIVGSKAREGCWRELHNFLKTADQR